jgi:hypothetical protein
MFRQGQGTLPVTYGIFLLDMPVQREACSSDMLVLITWHGRNVAIPLSHLTPLDADKSTVAAVGDWHYWVTQGYCF